MLTGSIDDCDACARGKAKKAPSYRSQRLYRYNRGECWHGDLQGPFRTQSKTGKKWALTYVEDHSGFCVCWLLAKKSDQFACLVSLIPWSVTQTGARIKVIRVDGDWISPTVIKDLQRERGFEMKATHRESPRENPLVENAGPLGS